MIDTSPSKDGNDSSSIPSKYAGLRKRAIRDIKEAQSHPRGKFINLSAEAAALEDPENYIV